MPVFWNIGLSETNQFHIPKNYFNWLLREPNKIASNPYAYKSTNFDDTRVASMGNFSIYYKVTNDKIIITAFWDNRQNPAKLLMILKEEK